MSDVQGIGNLMIVDDSEQDHFLYERVIKRSKLVDELLFFSWAQNALDYLKQQDRVEIQVILLDINMPRMNGFEFLEAVVSEFGDDNLNSDVIMLSTSLNEQDKLRAKSFNIVKAYMEKPLTIDCISEIAGLVRDA